MSNSSTCFYNITLSLLKKYKLKIVVDTIKIYFFYLYKLN